MTKKELNKIVRKQCREIDEHFKTGGWPLNYAFLKEDFLYAVFGSAYMEAADLFFNAVSNRYPTAPAPYSERCVYKTKEEAAKAYQPYLRYMSKKAKAIKKETRK